LEGPDADAVLRLELRLVAGLVAQLAGAPAPGTPVLALTGFERAVLAYLVLVVLSGLRSQPAAEGRGRPGLVGGAGDEADGRIGRLRLLPAVVEVRAGELSGDARLLLPESALRSVALGVAPPSPSAGHAARSARFSFRPRVLCGVLWPGEIRAFRPGTAVALPGMRHDNGQLVGPLQLSRSRAVLDGQLTSEGWTLGAIDTSPPTTEVTCVDPQLSTLPVELEVELARVPLTLGELSALAPGAIVPLRVSVGDPVFLRAGDRRVARAELVDLEGEVAARALDLLECPGDGPDLALRPAGARHCRRRGAVAVDRADPPGLCRGAPLPRRGGRASSLVPRRTCTPAVPPSGRAAPSRSASGAGGGGDGGPALPHRCRRHGDGGPPGREPMSVALVLGAGQPLARPPELLELSRARPLAWSL